MPGLPNTSQFATYASQSGAKPVAGDFDGDGYGDIALTGGEGWNTVPVLFKPYYAAAYDTNATVDQFPIYAAQPGSKPIAGDFDGDGFTDIALTGGAGWNSVAVAFSNGDGTFRVTNGPSNAGGVGVYATMPGAMAVAGDFNGDGRADIAVTGGAGWTWIAVAFSNGDGTFNPTFDTVATFPGYAQQGGQLVATDFDGDGFCDLAITGNASWNVVPIAYSLGDGNFTSITARVDARSDQFPVWAVAGGARALSGSQLWWQ
jgi:hypothetical protein